MSVRLRFTLWYVVSLLCVSGALLFISHRHLNEELREEKWERSRPGHEDWILHGAYTDREIHDILGELVNGWILVGGPLVALALALGYWLARVSIRPVAAINQQLTTFGPHTLDRRIRLDLQDPEYRELVEHLNALFDRLNLAFVQLNDYSAKVAHELRTPLTLLRLQIERAAADLDPELSESLQQELSRLTHYVDQSLLVARAEQGRLTLQPQRLEIVRWLGDLVEPFGYLSTTRGRTLHMESPSSPIEVEVDPRYFAQILHNLLENAFKHGIGDLSLRLRREPSGRTHLLLFNRRKPPEVRSASEGTGLGLRTVDALVSLHGPRLSARSRQTSRYWATRLSTPPSQGSD